MPGPLKIRKNNGQFHTYNRLQFQWKKDNSYTVYLKHIYYKAD